LLIVGAGEEPASWPTIGMFEVGRYPSGVDSCAERLSVALDSSGKTGCPTGKSVGCWASGRAR
jgi:hypothetical protein